MPLTSLGVALEPLVGAEACARRPTQLAADGFFLRDDEFDTLADQLVVILLARQRRRIRVHRQRLSGSANCDSVTLLPSLSTQASASLSFGCVQIDEHAIRCLLRGVCAARGEDHRRQGPE